MMSEGRIHSTESFGSVDGPGVRFLIFLQGCKLRCRYCHNADTWRTDGGTLMSADELLDKAERCRPYWGKSGGITVSGGEPLLQSDIKDFIKKIKELGYAVKLDTNGCYPEKLKAIVNEGLIDYVAMDVKNCLRDYGKTVGIKDFDTAPIKESVDFLINGNVDFEFRTTVVKELHTIEGIKALAREIKGAPRYFLQSFVDSGDLIGENLSGYDREILEEMAAVAKETLDIVEIRGI